MAGTPPPLLVVTDGRSIGDVPVVNLRSITSTSMHNVVYRALGRLSEMVPPQQWCLIGGLMVEVVLAGRGAEMARPTYDGDVIGDVVGHPFALRSLAHALEDQGFVREPTGWDGDFSVRFKSASGALIDVLRPSNTSKLRHVLGVTSGRRTLEASGTDFALSTATLITVVYSPDDPPATLRVPSLIGAIYAKASAAQILGSKDRPLKHLHDVAQLLAVARQNELENHPKAVAKRLRWLQQTIGDTNSPGWDHVVPDRRGDAARRLIAACDSYESISGHNR
jgi:hypothetical protein